MVTYAQAQERAEEWINGDVPAYQHREVRVREFELGFVVWGEDRAEGPRSDAGAQRLVIARDSGEATLWPALPVGEVIRRYEEEYGGSDGPVDAAPAPAARLDLNQTSFLLTPPEWLQEAADKLGIGERRQASADSGASDGSGASEGAGVPVADAGAAEGAGLLGGAAGTPAGPVAAPAASSAPATPATPTAAALTDPSAPVPADVPVGATPWAGTDTNGGAGEDDDRSVPLPATVFAPPLSGADEDAPPVSVPDAKTALMSGGSQLPRTAVAPALDLTNEPGAPGGSPVPGGAPGAPLGSTPPLPPPGAPLGSTPPPPSPGARAYGYPQGPAAPVPEGSTPPPAAPSGGYPPAPAGQAAPGSPGVPAGRPLAPNAGDIADAATSKAAPPKKARGGVSAPPPPPDAPGARPGSVPPPPAPGASPGGGYVPTRLVSAVVPESPDSPESAEGQDSAAGVPRPPAAPAGDVHHAATMLAGPGPLGPGVPQPPAAPGMPGAPGVPHAPGMPGAPGAQGGPGGSGMPPVPGAAQPPAAPGMPPVPGAPQPPGAPGMPGAPVAPGARGAVHQAETMLAAPPVGGPGVPPPPPPAAPGVPGMPAGAPGAPPPVAPPRPGVPVPGQPAAYGYPQAGQPTVGPGYQAVLRYRAQDGSEQQLIRRSAPGTPHPEWQIFHELRSMNVPPGQVLELHTELESCELPGAYCARMIREQWPQARITSIAPYGTDHASRQQGMAQLLAHQGELHQVADGPARPAPVRAPLPPVQAAPPVPPEAAGQELAAAFGPGVFRFEQQAVSRQGVPPVVAHTLVVAGLPVDMGPFFWAQAQPGRPVPTLAELAAERGVQPAADAGSYLVMGTDFGKALCVQYGTANIVAVPVEAGPGGAPVPPQFVNTGLPEFVRCLALLGRMWRLRYGLNQEQAGRWTVDFQAQLAALDPAALGSPESWWSVLLEQMWDGLL
ncbi:SUKH-4 family immunity protein [Streptomyces sp. AM6-12]|uniref:SUKH-4 family immunity protein n=1 Tax=Streptomyces sp. AM6-12 TaxID=3345149 RepID=UPI0037B871AF